MNYTIELLEVTINRCKKEIHWLKEQKEQSDKESDRCSVDIYIQNERIKQAEQAIETLTTNQQTQ